MTSAKSRGTARAVASGYATRTQPTSWRAKKSWNAISVKRQSSGAQTMWAQAGQTLRMLAEVPGSDRLHSRPNSMLPGRGRGRRAPWGRCSPKNRSLRQSEPPRRRPRHQYPRPLKQVQSVSPKAFPSQTYVPKMAPRDTAPVVQARARPWRQACARINRDMVRHKTIPTFPVFVLIIH